LEAEFSQCFGDFVSAHAQKSKNIDDHAAAKNDDSHCEPM